MSLPEIQPEYGNRSRADSYEKLDTILCVQNLEHLLDEARRLGALAVRNNGDVELDVDISEDSVRSSNSLNQPTIQFETANFFGIYDDTMLSYRIRHATEVTVTGAGRQALTREFWLFYDYDGDFKNVELNREYSRFSTSLERVSSGDYVRKLPNEGYPLQPLEAQLFESSWTDFVAINGYQFQQIETLAIRALDSLRAG